jgi:hypothetical protein
MAKYKTHNEQEPLTKLESKKDIYISTTKCIQVVCGHKVQPGDEYTLTKPDKENETAMLRVEHAVKLGLLKKA